MFPLMYSFVDTLNSSVKRGTAKELQKSSTLYNLYAKGAMRAYRVDKSVLEVAKLELEPEWSEWAELTHLQLPEDPPR